MSNATCFDRFISKTEQPIARKLVRAILNGGFVIRVYDGEEFNTDHDLVNELEVLENLGTTGDDRVYFRREGQEGWAGWFWLIYGNGEDLISDYTVSPETDKIADIVGC